MKFSLAIISLTAVAVQGFAPSASAPFSTGLDAVKSKTPGTMVITDAKVGGNNPFAKFTGGLAKKTEAKEEKAAPAKKASPFAAFAKGAAKEEEAAPKKPAFSLNMIKKSVAKADSPKKVVAKKAAPAKKVVAKKAVAEKKPISFDISAKAFNFSAGSKVVTKKVAPKKVAAKKVVAPKIVAKKVVAPKVVAKKVATKKVVAKKAAPKVVAKKVSVKKAAPVMRVFERECHIN